MACSIEIPNWVVVYGYVKYGAHWNQGFGRWGRHCFEKCRWYEKIKEYVVEWPLLDSTKSKNNKIKFLNFLLKAHNEAQGLSMTLWKESLMSYVSYVLQAQGSDKNNFTVRSYGLSIYNSWIHNLMSCHMWKLRHWLGMARKLRTGMGIYRSIKSIWNNSYIPEQKLIFFLPCLIKLLSSAWKPCNSFDELILLKSHSNYS